MFDTFLEELNTKLSLHEGRMIKVPEGLDECISKKGDGFIRSWLWDVPGFRRWRITRMDVGDKIQVFNSVAYPDYNDERPIMGIDLLWFGLSGKLIAVLDFQPLLQEEDYFDRYYKELKVLKSQYSDFNSSGDLHSYDPNSFFSPWFLLCRGGAQEAKDSLPSIFTKFLDAYLGLFENSKNQFSRINNNEVKKLQIAYDVYSAEKDPAYGLFKSYFGQKWSNAFLKEFLFPNSNLEA